MKVYSNTGRRGGGHGRPMSLRFNTVRIDELTKPQLLEHVRSLNTRRKEDLEHAEMMDNLLDELEAENNELKAESAKKDELMKSLLEENKLLNTAVPLTSNKDYYELFIMYIRCLYKVTLEDIRGNSREGKLPYIRQILCYFLYETYGLKLTEIAVVLNYGDHSTVSTNIQKVKETVDYNPELLGDLITHRNWIRKLNEK